MQKSLRANEHQLLYLANKAREDSLGTLSGNLWKKSLDTGKWQLRFFVLYQNLLFYYDCERAERPSGVAFLESSYCERIVTLKTSRDDRLPGQQGSCFAIYYQKEGIRQYDLRAESEEECRQWIDAINGASFGKLLGQKQEAEQKQLHLLQILDTERLAKWHYVQQTEELSAEVKKLRIELNEYRQEKRASIDIEDEPEEIKKIKKVQSFFRGWLCRRRWKQIVEEYIRSDHAESMRTRNSIVFGLVECEEEYVQQLSILVTCFLRPFRMAASSKKPIISHEDVNSIFLNAETVLFLHQFFVQGLKNKMENWPTLQLGDLFDMLLPMLGIYQEYVRNHHYSLQVLAELKQRPEFNQMLKRLEEKPMCEGRSLESFLTYPMHQIPRYIITLHELLAHTPHDHVDRKKLEYAKSKLEQISHIMHDEVSETENIRKNLAIERMIVDGCEVLLDVNQVFVRQGTLTQVICDKPRSSRSRLGNFGGSSRERKEAVRQVFLFTNHLLITARTNNGRLRLVKNYGKIALVECTLVEDTNADLFSMEDENTPNVEQTLAHPERKISDHISTGSRVCGSITPGYGTITSSLGIHNRSSVVVPPVLTEIGLAMKTSIRADSGPPSAGYVNRRFQSYDVSPRLSSASTSAAMVIQGGSGLSAPTGGMRSPTTNAALHRHSTSLCMSATDPENNNSTNGVSSRSSARPSLNTSHFLSGNGSGGGGTEVTALNVTAASGVAGPVNQPSTPGASVPFSHRFSSNFGVFTGSVGANGMDKTDYGSLDFRLIWEPKNGPPTSIWLVASTLQEKAAWCSDISQCIEQLHYGDILNSAQTDVSSVAMPQSIRSDPRLFKDDVDIKFSHTLNSCKVPQIRHASVGRLLDRLTDARFLSIDFLNTFLLTYRVFTTGLTVIWALKQVLVNADTENPVDPGSLLTQNMLSGGVGHTNPLEPSFPRETGPARYSDTAATTCRLPVLEERLSRPEESTSKSDILVSEDEDPTGTDSASSDPPKPQVGGIRYENPGDEETSVPKLSEAATTQPSSPSSSTVYKKYVGVKNRPKRLLTRPLSTSTTPTLLSPGSSSGGSRGDMVCMYRSEIVSEHPQEYGSPEPTQCPRPTPVIDLQTNLKRLSGPDSRTIIRSSLPPSSSPPPLIPRSPVCGGLRDDPPLQLPDLSDLIRRSAFSGRHRAGSESSEQNRSPARLAPLASCEVILDESEHSSSRGESDSARPAEHEPLKDSGRPDRQVQHNDRADQSAGQTNPTPVSVTPSTTTTVTTVPRTDYSKNEECPGPEKISEEKLISLEELHQLGGDQDKQTPPSHANDDGDGDGTVVKSLRPVMLNSSLGQSAGQLNVANGKEESTGLNRSWTVLNRPSLKDTTPDPLAHNTSMINLDASNRLLEDYMKQALGTYCIQGSGHFHPDNSPHFSEKHIEDLANGNDSKTETISQCSKSPLILSTITDSLDLATKIFKQGRSQNSVCRTLARNSILTALHCPGALVHLRQNGERQNSGEDGISRLDLNFPSGQLPFGPVYSSPSSPKKLSGANTKIKVTKASFRIGQHTRGSPNSTKSPSKLLEAGGLLRNSFRRRTTNERSGKPSGSGGRNSNGTGANVEDLKSSGDNGYVKDVNGSVQQTDFEFPSDKLLSVDDFTGEKEMDSSRSTMIGNAHRGMEKLVVSHLMPDRSGSDSSTTERTDSLTPRSSYGQLHGAVADCARGSVVSWSGMSTVSKPKRPSVFSCPDAEVASHRPSIPLSNIADAPIMMRARAGAVVTSSRRSRRRSSNTAAAQAFAVATAGSANPLVATGIMGFGPNFGKNHFRYTAGTATAAAANAGIRTRALSPAGNPAIGMARSMIGTAGISNPVANTTTSVGIGYPNSSAASSIRYGSRSSSAVSNGSGSTISTHQLSSVGNNQASQSNLRQQDRHSLIMTTASCLRVLNVVRHWITKFPEDFDGDLELKNEMKSLLEMLVSCSNLQPNDQKAAGQLLRQMVCDQLVQNRIDLEEILTPVQVPSDKNFDTLSALDISEQLTFLDFQIFRSIRSEELLNQSWMKPDKEEKAKHVLLVCKRFNEVSRLVVSEIISRTDLMDRVLCIDKWVAIADICRCMQNYNGVLQICAALVNSSVYRLRRTWERVSKQTKQSIDRLQMLVASDGRFKSMREALHRCDPPCIPYLGMYLTDLSFIEEGALNITESNLVNFCKMRMIAHVIREIQQYHQTPYLITHRREVTDYLLDPTRLLDEEQTYQASLTIEPRQSINRQPSSGCS